MHGAVCRKAILGSSSMCQLSATEEKNTSVAGHLQGYIENMALFLQNRKQKDKENQYTMQQNIASAASLNVGTP